MAKYSYITDKTHNNRKIQVESAKRDGSGKNIENNYAKQNGNYQSLTAGLSNNFDTKKVMVDESAYNFRPTATMGSVELEVGSPCKVKKIIGGSVAFNQLANKNNIRPTYTLDGVTVTKNNDGSVTFDGTNNSDDETKDYAIIYADMPCVSGHKYLWGSPKGYDASKIRFFISNMGTYQVAEGMEIDIASATQGMGFTIRVLRGASFNNVTIIPQFFDLTQMFGSTIADYIYSLEQANAGSGVAWFKRYFPKEYYAYNSGELVSVKTQGKKITHFNQWDEKWKLRANTYLTNKNHIKVIPNAQYFFHIGSYTTQQQVLRVMALDDEYNFIDYVGNAMNTSGWGYPNTAITMPHNASYIDFELYSNYGTTYNHDICINFHYDGERDGEYEPYNSETYACDDIDLRGIPQLDENNNLAFDGDEYANDGNVTRKYGIVDLGTLEWNYNSSVSLFNSTLTDGKTSTNLICKLYKPYELSGGGNDPDMCMFVYDGTLYITNSNYTDTQTFKTAMSGVYLVYELATPTDENSIPFTEVQECDNWGTEEWLAPTTDTRPCEVPVGHETDYLPDLKAKLEVAPNTPNENGVYVMEHNASGNSYTPIATWLADNGYAKADTLPTKDSVGGTLRQLLAVKETLDFDNTAYVDLGSLSWTYLGNNAFSATNVGVKSVANDSVLKALSTKYKVVSYNTLNGDATKVCMCGYVGDDSRIYIRDTNYTDATTFKNAMKGIILAYEKAS